MTKQLFAAKFSLYIITLFIAFGISFTAKATPDEKQHIEDKITEVPSFSPLAYDGIDVSSYQRDINWESVARDKRIQFVYIKATEGATYTSPHFEKNLRDARRRHIKVGSYHFLRATSSLKEQFDNFVKSARVEEQDLLPLIDMENKGNWSRKQLVDSLMAFANMLEQHYHCKPMIYTSSNFYNNYLWPFFNKYPLFIAKYSPNPPELKEGADYVMWQFTDNGSVRGIDGRVDQSRFNTGYDIRHILFGSTLSGAFSGDPRLVQPNMDMEMHMQTPSKFKTDFEKKRQREIEKREKAEQKRLQKEAREREKEQKKKDKEKKKHSADKASDTRVGNENTSDDDEPSYNTKMPTRRRTPVPAN